MLSLLTSPQIHEADAYTIANEPISSVNLMERAAKAFAGWFVNHFPDKKQPITIYCGTGDNGADGLAIARILDASMYRTINIIIARFSDKASDNFNFNLKRAQETGFLLFELKSGENIPTEPGQVIIDALLGSGLNRKLEGGYARLAEHINKSGKIVIAVDTPTGFFTDGDVPDDAVIVKADMVITFQQPKINFLLPESAPYIKNWEYVKIGINEDFIASLNSPYQFVEEDDIKKMLRPRHPFSNKGTYGHALIVAGEPETMGAALLSASACVYAGAGLTTACVPQSGLTALNTYMPEIMAIVRKEGEPPQIKWESFNTIGIGPGMGKGKASLALLTYIFANYKKPLVIDADALNILAEYKSLWKDIPENSVLTPHMKEFDRLFGEHKTWWQRIQTGLRKAKEHNVVILLKNDYTIVMTPGGKAYFNTTSNPAMATGGMGDVLTGIITSLLAQKYPAEEACIICAYLHGKAGDELAKPNLMNVVLPSMVAKNMPVIMAKLMA
jgi:NAD(P)H-hydrate epimerase